MSLRIPMMSIRDKYEILPMSVNYVFDGEMSLEQLMQQQIQNQREIELNTNPCFDKIRSAKTHQS